MLVKRIVGLAFVSASVFSLGCGSAAPDAEVAADPAGAAIVNASGPIRQIVQGSTATPRRFLAVAEVVNGAPGRIVQVQRD